MSGDIQLELWINQYQYDALKEALAQTGRTIEQEMQDRLTDLYCGMVPQEQRDEIGARIHREELGYAAEQEAKRQYAAFHVIENGEEKYFSTDSPLELLDAAKKVRGYLTAKPTARPAGFIKMFLHPSEISPERFEELACIRMENTGKVTGVFDIDFDKREFSGVHIMDGWNTYALGDVSAAAYHATRKHSLSAEQQLDCLLDHLIGKELTSAGHLSARNISFSDEIVEIDACLNFYVNTCFDVDAVFGTNVCTTENDDWLNVYANYDMRQDSVCDTLDVLVHYGDGSEQELSYTLNAAEKEVLRRKMDAYCLEQTGMGLKEYAAQQMAEELTPEPDLSL